MMLYSFINLNLVLDISISFFKFITLTLLICSHIFSTAHSLSSTLLILKAKSFMV